MEKTITLMPAMCKRCGQIFDLRYDMDSDEEGFVIAMPQGRKIAHCWTCRKF